MTDNKILVITGMHRSGTSLLTQWLYKCGLHVGDHFMGADIGNEDGHYEDLDFYQYHKNVLKEYHLPEDGMINEPLLTLSDDQLNEMKKLVDQKSATQQQWAWKEPRTCLFLDHYREILPEARYLVILRDYRSVVSSLISRIYSRTAYKYSRKKGLSKFFWDHFKKHFRKRTLLRKHSERFLQVWIAYNEAILHHLQKLNPSQYLVVDHTALSGNNKQVFEHLSGTWDFKLEYYNYANVYKENLLSKVLDIARYVKHSALLTKADTLHEELKNLV
jgi:hypothetical protein